MAEYEPGTNGGQAAANFVADVQARLVVLMGRKGISRALLAKRLGVSRSRVTQLFGPHPNMTVDTLARIFEALGEVPEIVSPGIRSILAEFDAEEADASGLSTLRPDQGAAAALLLDNVVHLSDYLEATKAGVAMMTGTSIADAAVASAGELLELAA